MRIGIVAAVLGVAVGVASGSSSAQDATQQPLLPDGDAEAGAEFYATECRGCHAVSIAPTLRGVIDRPAASVSAFAGYSDALKARSSVTWSLANIDAFISDPQAFAPGSLMTKSIADAQQRADIIAYIATLPPPRN
jgi:cytochrome c